MHKIATRRQLKEVLIFSIAYLSIAAVFIIAEDNHEFLLYLAVLSVIIIAVIGVYNRAGLRVNQRGD